MELIVSGVDERAWCGVRVFDDMSSTTSVVAAEEFIRLAEIADPAGDKRLFVWTYMPPWTLQPYEDTPSSPRSSNFYGWLETQRAILRLRLRLGDRLSVINVSALGASKMLPHLQVEADQQGARPERLRAMSEGRNALLAKLYEWVAPEVWDTYEALETIGLHAAGTPELRSSLKPPHESELISLMEHLRQGLLVPTLQSELRANNEQLLSARATLQQTEESLLKLEKAADAWAEERAEMVRNAEELSSRAHQVQEQLEILYIQKQEHIAKVAKDKAKIAVAKQSSDNKVRQLTEELLVLQQRVYQVQEELEQYYLAIREMQAVMSNTTQTMHQARAALTNSLLND